MKMNRLTGTLLSTFAALALQQAVAQPLNLHPLTNNIYTQNFDGLLASTNPWTLGTLPNEWSVYLNVTPTTPGTIAPFTNNFDSWDFAFTGDFKNFAGAFDYIGQTNFLGTESWEVQTNEPNRCLGIRQTGAFGDPGAAFVLKLADTVNLHNFALSMDMLNLDASSQRQTTWTVEYGWADAVFGIPVNFFPAAVYTNVPGTFNTYHTNIALPDGTINNFNGQIWIRVSALTPSEGANNRESFAIDNVGLTWTNGTGGCTRIHVSGNPVNTTIYSNATATFTVASTGTSPYYYQWYKDNSPLSDVGNIVGSQAFQLQVRNATSADQGSYKCVVSNYCAETSQPFTETSAAATLTITNAPAVSIGFLRTLVDTNKYFATNQTALWRATGLITTATNITAANTASFYLQDGTGGINLFVTGGGTYRPNMGDVVTCVGFLSSFNGGLELLVDLTTGAADYKKATLVQTLSNNIAAFPAPKVISWDNLGGFPTNANLNYNVVGSYVWLTNVYFYTNAGAVTVNQNRFYWVTNSLGQYTQVGIEGQQVSDLTNRTLPFFASRVQGILIGFTQTGLASPTITNGNYEVIVTRWVDVVTNFPITIVRSGADNTITWTAIPNTDTYTVRAASQVVGPYNPIATGLKFTTTAGTYTDVGAGGDQKYYRVTTP